MSAQFKITGLEAQNQAFVDSEISVIINKNTYSGFNESTELFFSVNGNVVPEWPSAPPASDVPFADVYTFKPSDLGLTPSDVEYELSLEVGQEQYFEDLGSKKIKVVGVLSIEDDPNTYILAPFVSAITKIDLENGQLELEQSWEEFTNLVSLKPKVPASGYVENGGFTGAKISYKANEVRDLTNYIHLGEDNKVLITNLVVDKGLFPESPYSIVLKLYEPLDENIQEKDKLFIVQEILPQLTETVELIPYEQEDENVNVLFTPDSVNVQAPISKRQLISKNRRDLITDDKKLQQEILDKFI